MADALSRRERQIMAVVHRRGQATVAEVHAELEDAPSYSAVRALMGTLEAKGHLSHRADGRSYVYRPTQAPQAARRSALEAVVATFFGGSPGRAAVALVADGALDAGELEALEAAIARAREAGK